VKHDTPGRAGLVGEWESDVEPIQPFQVTAKDAELVIFMMFGGDNNLSRFVAEDLDEMARGIGGKVAAVRIQTLEDWGEIDTGDPETLCRFLTRALITYPHARKAIGFWDHGTGVFDETDATEKFLTRSVNSVARAERSRSYPARRLFFPKDKLAKEVSTRAMLHDETNGGILTTMEAGKMIGAAFQRAGQQGKIDLIFSDTCLNGMIEVLDELGRYATCVVGSPELEPGDGWDYQRWMALIASQPPATPEDWGRTAVQAFSTGYEKQTSMHPCTLGAFRTEHQMTAAFKNLMDVTRGQGAMEAFFLLDHGRAKSQGYAKRDTYDLKNFAERVAATSQTGKPALAEAARNLSAACDAARVHWCCHGSTVTDSYGLAFWFPSSRSTYNRDITTYSRLSFSTQSGWGDFLKEFR
jgi:hypothetical protein